MSGKKTNKNSTKDYGSTTSALLDDARRTGRRIAVRSDYSGVLVVPRTVSPDDSVIELVVTEAVKLPKGSPFGQELLGFAVKRDGELVRGTHCGLGVPFTSCLDCMVKAFCTWLGEVDTAPHASTSKAIIRPLEARQWETMAVAISREYQLHLALLSRLAS